MGNTTYVWEYIGRSENNWYGSGITKHDSIWAVAMHRAILLVQLLLDHVERLFRVHVPHEP